MKCSFLCLLFFTLVSNSQIAKAQSVPISDKAVFYNFIVSKCNTSECALPYTVSLDGIKTIAGSFKGLNNRIQPVLESDNFLITVYDKRSGKKEWETVMANPVSVNIEYDAMSTDGESGSTLQRRTVDQEEGSLAVRLPYGPRDCTIRISYIASPDRVTELATF